MSRYRYVFQQDDGVKAWCGFPAENYYDAQIKSVDVLRYLMREGRTVVKSVLVLDSDKISKGDKFNAWH